MRSTRGALLATALLAAACAGRAPVTAPSVPERSSLAGQFVLAPAADNAKSVRVGGLSGLTRLEDGETLAVVDDREHPRVFRLRVNAGPGLQVRVGGIIPLQPSPQAPPALDAEGIALTCDGHMLITSEGIGDEEPRLPPAILEYAADGRFIRQLGVDAKFAPTAHGRIQSGVRDNAGFESLTLSDDCSRLFTASELPLLQDDEADAFRRGVRTRLLEYRRQGGTYVPAREFAYEIEPVDRPSFTVRTAINGIVELLSAGGDTLLALERAYVESADRSQSLNRIRIFEVDLAGATDVAARHSIFGWYDVKPVRKKLLLDVNSLRGLTSRLALLDNFEGMAWGPRARDGSRSLLLVSDDNFSEKQVTAFLMLRLSKPLQP